MKNTCDVIRKGKKQLEPPKPSKKVTVVEVKSVDLPTLISEELKKISEAGLEPNVNPSASITTDLRGSRPPDDQLDAIMKKQRIMAIIEFWKNFKPSEENIHIESENTATISDGAGTSFVMFFKLNSYEPPVATCESLKKVNISPSNLQ